MKIWIRAGLRWFAALACLSLAPAASAEEVNFDSGWLFAKGDIAGAETVAGAEADWRKVDLPHDWAITGNFDRNALSTGSGGWLPTGIVWYRKRFTLPAVDRGKRVFVEFGGIMERGGVWINGHHVGHRPNGYSTVRYDITDHLNWDGPNVLAVRADTSFQPASRWYAGGGIYRSVRLITTGQVHVEAWGTYVTTPQVSAERATVRVESSIRNQTRQDARVRIEMTFTGPDGKVAGTAISQVAAVPAGRVEKLAAEAVITRPRLWDVGQGNLYAASVRVVGEDGAALDSDRVTFGVRDIAFKADTGFWINGRNVKLKGTAIHADGGAFGMAVPLAFYERRLRGLQALGVNAIRTAHHPFSREFMDLCDRLGILVMNEAFDMWTVAKNPHDYHLFFGDWSSLDAREFARRDRNHPSVVIWSVGNEIHDTPYPLVAKANLARLKKIFNEEDPSRPVTMALFRPNVTGDYRNGLADMLDVVGQNYRENELTQAHRDKPTRKIIGTENTKGRANWLAVRDFAPYSGMFLWTGADYLGEADRAGWPNISNPSGLVDRTDVVKSIGWERASWWSETPMVKIGRRTGEYVDTSGLPTTVAIATPQPKDAGVRNDWTPASLAPHAEKVELVTNAASAELFLNGKSLGRKPANTDASAIAWDVPFAPGELRAVAYDAAGKAVAYDALRTAGAPAAIRLIAEQTALAPGFDRVGFVRVELVDAKGVLVPGAAIPLTVRVSGAGTLAAFDNGDPADTTPFASAVRKAWSGRALAMVRAAATRGTITVEVTGEGLRPAQVTLRATAP